MKMFLRILIMSGAFLIYPGAVQAQSTLPLQKQCAKGAAAFVSGNPNVISYYSHYNRKLDRCFVRVGFWYGAVKKTQTVKGKKYTMHVPFWGIGLYDAFSGEEIGDALFVGLSPSGCSVRNRKCKSADEFDKLIRPYMEQ